MSNDSNDRTFAYTGSEEERSAAMAKSAGDASANAAMVAILTGDRGAISEALGGADKTTIVRTVTAYKNRAEQATEKWQAGCKAKRMLRDEPGLVMRIAEHIGAGDGIVELIERLRADGWEATKRERDRLDDEKARLAVAEAIEQLHGAEAVTGLATSDAPTQPPATQTDEAVRRVVVPISRDSAATNRGPHPWTALHRLDEKAIVFGDKVEQGEGERFKRPRRAVAMLRTQSFGVYTVLASYDLDNRNDAGQWEPDTEITVVDLVRYFGADCCRAYTRKLRVTGGDVDFALKLIADRAPSKAPGHYEQDTNGNDVYVGSFGEALQAAQLLG